MKLLYPGNPGTATRSTTGAKPALRLVSPPSPPAAFVVPPSTGFAKFDLLQWLTPETRAAFLSRLKRRRYKPAQTIYLQGSPGVEMYRVASGTVKVSAWRADGRHITYRFLEPGDCFGQTSLIDGEPRPQTTEAWGELEVDVLSQSEFHGLSRECPGFDHAILRLMAAQMRAMALSYEGASFDSLEVRVARHLLQVHATEQLCAPPPAPGARKLRLSQTELAALVGGSRQSVNRVLQALKARRLIEVSYGCVGVVDAVALGLIVAQ